MPMYNPGVTDRSGELMAQGIGQLGQSIAGGIQQYGARKEKEQNLLSEARGRGRALRNTIKGLESLNILPAGMSDDLTKAEETMAPRNFLAYVNEASDKIGGLITAGSQAQQVRAKQEADRAQQERMARAQQEMAQINAPGQSRVQDQIGANATLEQLSTDPRAFQATAGPGINEKIQRVMASPNIPLDQKDSFIRALIAQDEAGKPANPQNLGCNEQAVAAEIAARTEQLGRPLTKAETSDAFRVVSQRSNLNPDPEVAARVGMLAKELPLTGERGDVAMRLLPSINSLNKKMEEGVKTGKLESFKTDVLGIARSLGIPVDEAALGKSESSRAQYGSFLLQAITQTKGAVTERENTLFAAMGPQFEKSNAANEELLKLLKVQMEQDIELGNIYRNGMRKNTSFSTIVAEQQDARAKYAKKYDAMLSEVESKFGVTLDNQVNAILAP